MNYPEELRQKAIKQMQNCYVDGFLSGAGNPNAKLMLIGEAPGKTEIQTKKPFSGKAGLVLDQNLKKINLTRDDIYITSTVRSRPYKQVPNKDIAHMPNRKPIQKEIAAHAILLDFEITQINPRIIATLGSVALQRLLGGKYKLNDWHGKLITTTIKQWNNKKQCYTNSKNKFIIIPMYHPAAIFYNPKLQDIISQDWQQLKQALQNL